MASLTFAIPEEIKSRLSKFPWINWSELAREELSKQEKERETLERVRKILSKSKFTEKNAKELADEVKASLHRRYKKVYSDLS